VSRGEGEETRRSAAAEVCSQKIVTRRDAMTYAYRLTTSTLCGIMLLG